MSCGTLVPALLLSFSSTGLLPSSAALSIALPLKTQVISAGPQPRGACSAVWPLSRSLAATQEITFCFLFLRVLRCFSSPGALLPDYGFIWRCPGIALDGFPHSDIHGSSLACSSPWLFAACRVLLRRLAPWHPPCALIRLIFSSLLLLRPTTLSDTSSHSLSSATGLLSNLRLLLCAVVKVPGLPLASARRTLKTIQASFASSNAFDSFSSVSHGPRFAFALPCPPLAVFAAFFPMLSHRPTWFTRRRFLRLAP